MTSVAAYSQDLLFANNAQSTLAGSISDSQTTINLASGGGADFPTLGAGQAFPATITDAATGLLREIVLVTARTGDTLTVVRAQEGTTGLAWAANDLFAQLVTAGDMTTFLQLGQAQAQASNYGEDTGSVNAYVLALAPVLANPVAGMPIRILVGNTNTGPSTVNPGPGSADVVRRDGSDFIGGEWLADTIQTFFWNDELGKYQWAGVAPATAAAVTAATDTQSYITPAQLAAASFAPVGTLLPFAGLTAPTGWLKSYAQELARTGTYANLFAAITEAGTCTISIATPAVITKAAHGLVAGDKVSFETTGALPTGLAVGTNYYVIAAGLSGSTFEVSTTPTGAAVNTTGSQSGIQTLRHNPFGCGNGTTTFNAPDGRNVLAGADNMSGADIGRWGANPSTGGIPGAAVIGTSGGSKDHVQTTAELRAHIHAVPGQIQSGGNDIVGVGSVTYAAGLINDGASSSTGSSTAFNITPPVLFVNVIVKY